MAKTSASKSSTAIEASGQRLRRLVNRLERKPSPTAADVEVLELAQGTLELAEAVAARLNHAEAPAKARGRRGVPTTGEAEG